MRGLHRDPTRPFEHLHFARLPEDIVLRLERAAFTGSLPPQVFFDGTEL